MIKRIKKEVPRTKCLPLVTIGYMPPEGMDKFEVDVHNPFSGPIRLLRARGAPPTAPAYVDVKKAAIYCYRWLETHGQDRCHFTLWADATLHGLYLMDQQGHKRVGFSPRKEEIEFYQS